MKSDECEQLVFFSLWRTWGPPEFHQQSETAAPGNVCLGCMPHTCKPKRRLLTQEWLSPPAKPTLQTRKTYKCLFVQLHPKSHLLDPPSQIPHQATSGSFSKLDPLLLAFNGRPFRKPLKHLHLSGGLPFSTRPSLLTRCTRTWQRATTARRSAQRTPPPPL